MSKNLDAIIWTNGPVGKNLFLRYIGPYKIAHYVRKRNHSIQVLDNIVHMSEEQLYHYTKKFIGSDTKLLAISTTFLSVQPIYIWPEENVKRVVPQHVTQVIERLKEEYPNLRVVLGGYNSDSPAVNVLCRSDFYIVEYGEDIFVELLEHRKFGTPAPYRLPEKQNKRVAFTKARNPTFNIECDDHQFVNEDCIVPGETLPIEISRGCIFKCKFCNHLLLGRGKLDYLRDFELVKEAMIRNYEKWGTKNYFIICDTFNDTTTKMELWHKAISSLPFKITYTAYLRADLLHRYPDVPIILKETGLSSAFHGIESFGTKASTVIGKGWSGKEAKDWLPKLYHDIWNKDVYQHLSFIVGLPGDTRESLIDTANWFIDNDMYSGVFQTLRLEPTGLRNASEFEKNAEKYGYQFNDNELPMNWSTDYWTWKEADEFCSSTLKPLLLNKSARWSNWVTQALMTYNFKHKDFYHKELLNSTRYNNKIIKGSAKYLKTYFKLLDQI